MSISVNGVAITEASIEQEMQLAKDAGHPGGDELRDGAVQELVLRQLLLQKAASLGITHTSDQEAIGELLSKEIVVTPADDTAARAFYEANPDSFKQGESASANHILFALGDGLGASLAKAKAEGVLAEVQANPTKFAALAREHSTCPSSQQGGSLGQFGRGQMVPEFEQAVFSTNAGEITPTLVETQFGYHIIQVTERKGGEPVAYDEVKDRLQSYLTDVEGRKATHAYLSTLVAAAKIEGYSFPAFA
jgi:peptidyl-prolyl cis-trans isomerase C